jgi:hypothetical protein
MIRDIVAKWPGATHDAHIWNNCKLAKVFEDSTIKGAWLLGDSGYALKPWLLTPILSFFLLLLEQRESITKHTNLRGV